MSRCESLRLKTPGRSSSVEERAFAGFPQAASCGRSGFAGAPGRAHRGWMVMSFLIAPRGSEPLRLFPWPLGAPGVVNCTLAAFHIIGRSFLAALPALPGLCRELPTLPLHRWNHSSSFCAGLAHFRLTLGLSTTFLDECTSCPTNTSAAAVAFQKRSLSF